jgi:hypothetical protein
MPEQVVPTTPTSRATKALASRYDRAKIEIVSARPLAVIHRLQPRSASHPPIKGTIAASWKVSPMYPAVIPNRRRLRKDPGMIQRIDGDRGGLGLPSSGNNLEDL